MNAMKRERWIYLAVIAFASCAKELPMENPTPENPDRIKVTSSVEVTRPAEAISKGVIYPNTAFGPGDKVLMFAISRSVSSTDMPQSDVPNFTTPNSFYWFKATGTYESNPTMGSPFKVTGISTNPDASLYSNVPGVAGGGFLDFYACGPESAKADISLRVLDNKYGDGSFYWPAYSGTKSIWFDTKSDPYNPPNNYDPGGWTASGLKRTHEPIDFIYAVDGTYTHDTPLVMKHKEPISMRFKHALALVEVKIFRREGSAAATLNEISFKPWQRAYYIRATDGTLAVMSNGADDGYYYRYPNLSYVIPAGQANATTLTQKFILCPNRSDDNTPSLNYNQTTYGCISTMLTINNGAPQYVKYGNDKTVFKPGYKYTVSIAIGLNGLEGSISVQPWIVESSQEIVF